MELTKETSLFKKDAIKTDVNKAASSATDYINDVDGSERTGMTLQPASNSADNYMQLDATEIGIYQNGYKIASYGDIITLYRLLNNNTAKTLEITNTGLYLYGSNTTNADVLLTAAGLSLEKGGIKAGIPGQSGFIYLSTEDYPLKDSNITPSVAGLTINEYTPTAAQTDGRTTDDAPWRQVIGTKFGVDKDGKLYAADVNVTGNINAITGTIAAGVTIGGKSQTEYLNSEIYKNAGFRYSKDIIVYGDSDKYYPVYFNNNQNEYNQNIPHEIMISRSYTEQAPDDWNTSTYKGGLTLQIKWNYGGWGGATYKAEILAFNEIYSTMVGDVVVGTGSGMLSTVYLRGGGSTGALYHIYSDIIIESTRYGGNFPLIGTTEGATIMETGSYSWQVVAPLITPNTAHIKSLIAENTASNYITYIDNENGIKVHSANDSTNYAKINSDGLQVCKNDIQVASFGEESTIGISSSFWMTINSNGVSFKRQQWELGRIELESTGNTFRFGRYPVYVDGSGTGYVGVDLQPSVSMLRWTRPNGSSSTLRLSENWSYMELKNSTVSYSSGVSSIPYGRIDITARDNSTEDITINLSSSKYIYFRGSRIYFNPPSDSGYTADGSSTYIYMQYIDYDTSGSYIMTGSNGYLTRGPSSSKRYKYDIKLISSEELNPHKLYDIDVVQFIYNDEYLNNKDQRFRKKIPGFIAEDIYTHYPIAANLKDGRPEDWNHRFIIPPMLKLIQEQHEEIEKLKIKINTLEEKIS